MAKEMEFKNITIDELAGMMNQSFQHLEDKMDKGFAEVHKTLHEHSHRFDRMENILIADNLKRIERLEDKMLQVEVTLGKKF